MTLQQIAAADIAGWDSLRDIASTFEKRGLKPQPNLGEDDELVLQLADDEFIVLVNAGPGEAATNFKPDNRSQHTNLVATNDFEEFTFLTRMRSWEGQQHGRIKHQKISFTKNQFARERAVRRTLSSRSSTRSSMALLRRSTTHCTIPNRSSRNSTTSLRNFVLISYKTSDTFILARRDGPPNREGMREAS